MSDVLFVSMPFGPVFTPSIGLSLLQAHLHRAGVASDVRYFSIRFAERLGSRLYTAISQSDGVPIVNLAGMVPISISGIGVREAGYLYFLRQIGVHKSSAVALGILSSATVLLNGLIGGLIYLAWQNRRKASGA